MLSKRLIAESVEQNKLDNKKRYVYYENGSWTTGTKFPYEVDFPTVYEIEHGTVRAIAL